jgi:hypothetical protein
MDLGIQLAQYRLESRLGWDVSPGYTNRIVPGLYLAHDTELNLEVAFRILPQGYSDSELTQRIVKRAKAALALRHPNIAGIYNIGRASDDWWVATEYVYGELLHGKE